MHSTDYSRRYGQSLKKWDFQSGYYAGDSSSPILIAKASLVVMGVLIFWKRSDDWMAILMSAALMTVMAEGILVQDNLQWAVKVIFMISWAIWFYLPFVFPSGRFEPRWARWIVFLITILSTTAYAFYPDPGLALLMGSTAWMVLTLYAIPYRYLRVSNPIERQQTKWIGIGLIGTILASLPWVLHTVMLPPSSPSIERVGFLVLNMILYPLMYATFAICIGISILRYRLWDIDLIVRRTLVYGILTGTLALLYFSLVTLLQALSASVFGLQSPVVIVLSTLAIAAVFNPLRKGIQNLLDRRFYRNKYNAELALANFATAARNETDIKCLNEALIDVIQETMQPETVTLWH